MIQNIDKVIDRGEKIDILVSKTSDLSDNALQFRKGARKLKYNVIFTNIKIFLLIGIIILVSFSVSSLSPLHYCVEFANSWALTLDEHDHKLSVYFLLSSCTFAEALHASGESRHSTCEPLSLCS